MEFQYSKSHSEALIAEEIKSIGIDLFSLDKAIDDYLYTTHKTKSGKVWETKNKRIKNCIPDFVSGSAISSAILLKSYGFTQSIQELISKLMGTKLVVGDTSDVLSTWAELLGLAEGNLFELERIDSVDEVGNKSTTVNVVSNYEISEELGEYLDEKQYIPPCLIQPRNWENGFSGGLYTQEESAFLGHHTSKHDMDISLDVLNILQSYKWTIDADIAAMDELPNKELSGDDLAAFNQQKDISKALYKEYMSTGFYWIWKFDKRGRVYSQGYHINLQSYGYKKALVCLPESVLITGDL